MENTNSAEKGVSLIVCCHNGEKRIAACLLAISEQEQTGICPYEVVVVDNASNDDTSHIARRILSGSVSSGMWRIVREPRPGLSHAREKGVKESRYEYISFIDDDNHVEKKWVEKVYRLMEGDESIGACGGMNSGTFEIDPPGWFYKFSRCYAIGPQGEAGGDITKDRGELYGAGLTIRRSALEGLQKNGYRPFVADRTGARLVSGGDSELCFALRLAGWKLWYEPDLHLKHYMPKARLTWTYLRNLFRGFGYSSVSLDPYRYAVERPRTPYRQWLELTWLGQVTLEIKHAIVMGIRMLKGKWHEGEEEVLSWEYHKGRIAGLFLGHKTYASRLQEIHTATWIVRVD